MIDKRMQTAGGIAVIYAPNGTGKTSFANLLSTEVSNENIFFDAVDERGNRIAPESGVFHVIQDQINRNVIRGETTDYLIGAQIRREYDLRNQINILFRNAYDDLASKYKSEFKVSKVKDYLLDQISVLQHQTAYEYIRSIVNVRTHMMYLCINRPTGKILLLVFRPGKDLKIWYLRLKQIIQSMRRMLKIQSIILLPGLTERIRISFFNI